LPGSSSSSLCRSTEQHACIAGANQRQEPITACAMALCSTTDACCVS
jgi:hypothetical protein